MKKTIIRTYSELISLPTFEERYLYLKLDGSVGQETFGFDRWINQVFYKSSEWKSIKRKIVLRDSGCDLGVEGYEIQGSIYIHHMNPVELTDIVNRTEYLLNPEYLICTSFNTHNGIHYGNKDYIPYKIIQRERNDTCPWRKE